jgi:hypothetical protein
MGIKHSESESYSKVSAIDRDSLNSEISKNELFSTLKSMKNGKSCGLDGLPCDVLKCMSDSVGDGLFQMAREAFSYGQLLEFLNQGLIKLILKTARDANGLETHHFVECLL